MFLHPANSCSSSHIRPKGPIFKRNNKHKAVGTQTVWVPPSTAAILVHVGGAAQSAKGRGESQYSSEGVVINKYTVRQSHHWSHLSNGCDTHAVTHDNNGSTNETSDSGI